MHWAEGEYFEQRYRLKRPWMDSKDEVRKGWIAEDTTESDAQEILIEWLPFAYDGTFHWAGNVEGLITIGQSRKTNLRFLVWRSTAIGSITPALQTHSSKNDQKIVYEIIHSLPLGNHELLLGGMVPEVWMSERGELLLIYHKQSTNLADPASNAEIKAYWKKILAPDIVPGSRRPVRRSIPYVLITTGLILGIFTYLLRMDRVKGADTRTLSVMDDFNQAIEEGIRMEKRGEFQKAYELFRQVGNAPDDNQINRRRDSLARAYLQTADRECERFKSSASTHLYFIPNQYYQYASMLTGSQSPHQCD